MKRKLSAAALFASLALGLGFTGTANASAATGVAGAARTAVSAEIVSGSAMTEQVNHRRGHYGHRNWRRDRHRHRNYRPRSGFYFQFGTPYRYQQPRYHAPRPVYRLSHSHYRWCQSRYRSYRSSDNTFQPYGGPRRQCVSPYI